MTLDNLFAADRYLDVRKPGRFAASEFAVHALANWVLDQVLDT